MIKKNIISIYTFYRDGFRGMTIGRTLWVLILIKLFLYPFPLFLVFTGIHLNLHSNHRLN